MEPDSEAVNPGYGPAALNIDGGSHPLFPVNWAGESPVCSPVALESDPI